LQRDDGHSATLHEVVSRYIDGEVEVVLVKRQTGSGATDFVIHVEPKVFTTAGIQWTHFLELLGFRYFYDCPYVSGRRCLWRRWEGKTNDAERITEALKEAYRRVREADELLSGTPLKLPESNSGWLFFFVPEDMERHKNLLTRLAEL